MIVNTFSGLMFDHTQILVRENELGMSVDAIRTVTWVDNGNFYDPDDGLPLFFAGDMRGEGDGRLPNYGDGSREDVLKLFLKE